MIKGRSFSIARTCIVSLVIGLPFLGAVELPAKAFRDLGSGQFKERERAQIELLRWGRANPAPAMEAFFAKSREADDPEVRERCLSILRDLVADEYLKEGEGYMGINPANDILKMPGETKQRSAIRVLFVQPGSPAEKAGLRIDDLVVEVAGEIWPELQFREKIKMMKPNSEVALQVFRAGNMIPLRVRLGKRPPSAGFEFLNGRQIDPEAAERAASEAYFRRWLSQRKLQK